MFWQYLQSDKKWNSIKSIHSFSLITKEHHCRFHLGQHNQTRYSVYLKQDWNVQDIFSILVICIQRLNVPPKNNKVAAIKTKSLLLSLRTSSLLFDNSWSISSSLLINSSDSTSLIFRFEDDWCENKEGAGTRQVGSPSGST